MTITSTIAQEIIAVFNRRESGYDFDSHEFISVLEKCYPHLYYSGLLEHIPQNSEEKAYRLLHGSIGQQLSAMSDVLGIESRGKHETQNYRGVNSKNEMWKKK